MNKTLRSRLHGQAEFAVPFGEQVQEVEPSLARDSGDISRLRGRSRCPLAEPICAEEEPPLRTFGLGHVAACHQPLRTPTDDIAPAGIELRV